MTHVLCGVLAGFFVLKILYLVRYCMSTSDREVYATQPRPLLEQIHHLLEVVPSGPEAGEVVAAIVPDTNLLHAGRAAAAVYKTLQGRKYDTVILVAPSHTGPFGRIHICSVDEYPTILGGLRVNDQVRNELCDEDDDIFLDNKGHFHTDGIDVQLPFLQTVLGSNFAIVPIIMGDESPDFCRELGHAIGEIMYSRRALLVASANLLESVDEGVELFREHLESGDVPRLMALLNSGRVRVEGRGPLLVALIAAQHRKADNVQILDLEAPEEEFGGYLGAIIIRN